MALRMISGDSRLYGEVVFEGSVIVEAGCVIGHPSAAAVAAGLAHSDREYSFEEFYNRIAVDRTVIGDGCVIRSGTVIYGGVSIGMGFECGHNVLIREDVVIGSSAYVKSYTEIMKLVRIGSDCRLAGTIADRSQLADRVSSFGTLTHVYSRHYVPEMSLEPGPSLLDEVIVGRGAVLIGPITVGRGAVIGANAIVRRDVPPGSLVVGPSSMQR